MLGGLILVLSLEKSPSKRRIRPVDNEVDNTHQVHHHTMACLTKVSYEMHAYIHTYRNESQQQFWFHHSYRLMLSVPICMYPRNDIDRHTPNEHMRTDKSTERERRRENYTTYIHTLS